MMKRMTACLGLLIAAPGIAAAQEKIAISIGGVELEAPMPAGYCLPTGKNKAAADLLAAADTENVTHASLFRCDQMATEAGPGNDYYLLKTPRRALVATVSRPELIAGLAREFGKAEWQEGGTKAASLTEKASGSISETFNARVEVKGSFSPRGTDADCVYMGGEATVSMPDISYPIQAGACLTSVGNKMITVYTYDDPKGSDGVVRLMRRAQALAMAFKPVAGKTP